MAMTMSMKIMNRRISKKFQTLMTICYLEFGIFIANAIEIVIAIKIS
jgi:hypothetical protein